MVNFEMADLIAVLQLVAPYLIAAGVVIVACVVALVALRKRPRPQRILWRGGTVIGSLLALLLIANLIAFGPMSTLIGLATGSGQVTDETVAEALPAAEEVAAEGIVLLQNDGLLPLADGGELNLFGWASSNPVYGGAGSGGINDLFETVSLVDGLKNSGFSVNEDLLEFYQGYTSDRPEMSIQKQSWTLPEPPASTYGEDLLAGAKEFSDTAVIVVSRMAGEGHNDMPTDVSQGNHDDNSTEYADFEAGEHYLQLSQTEEDLVELVTSNFDDVVVVYNGANPLEMGFVDEHPEIRSVVWAPGPGNVGFNALGGILAGEINPSGKTPDTFVYDYKAAPWWNNQVMRNYENLENFAVEGMNFGKPQMFYPSFINYVEGIYVGYKFYETAAAEGLIDYDATVQYPFGHGLSYTTFTQEMGELQESGGTLSVDVTVTNTGDTAGKDVVQLYSNPPYTEGGIEKATANLITFAKTGLLEPGASETVTLSVDAEDLASYDMSGEGGYVLEAGDYELSVNSNSHDVLDSQTFTVSSEESFTGDQKRESDDITAANLFGDAAGDVTYLSRAGGFANYAQATAAPTDMNLAEPFASEYHVNANYDPTAYLDPADDMPTTGADGDLRLQELRGADYDDPRWDELLDQVTVDEMGNLIALAGYQTAAVDSVGKRATVDSDGPAAINNNFTGKGSPGFPVAVMIASTWNVELAEVYGQMMGKMSRDLGSAGWYAPAMNTHRIAFGARNYEYYSEDGMLAGLIAAGAVRGAESEGVYSYIKHFAMYDFNGKMVSVWSNEQAMREIYLKPFELSVKDGGADAVMVSWNYLGHRWVGEWRELNETVLRDEWGFRGLVITDFFRNNGQGFMTADMALSGGVDGMLSTFEGGPNNVADPTAATTVQEMRRATKNFMYTVANSWVHDEERARQGLLPWQQAAIAINVAAVALLGASAAWTWKRYRKASADS